MPNLSYDRNYGWLFHNFKALLIISIHATTLPQEQLRRNQMSERRKTDALRFAKHYEKLLSRKSRTNRVRPKSQRICRDHF